jgi:hypothetical protein
MAILNLLKNDQARARKASQAREKVACAKKVVASDSELPDESMHNFLESRIPCKRKYPLKMFV